MITTATLNVISEVADRRPGNYTDNLAYYLCASEPDYIRQLRERAGLTQMEVAAALDVSQALISLCESGKQTPQAATCHEIIRLLAWMAPDTTNEPEHVAVLRTLQVNFRPDGYTLSIVKSRRDARKAKENA